jgi:hypothetical protein
MRDLVAQVLGPPHSFGSREYEVIMGALKVWDGATWQTVAHGAAGNALPAGGATNMLLAKQSTADADAAWTTAPVVTSISIGTISTTVTFAEAANIATGSTTGTMIGTSATQKIGFWGATPRVPSPGWSIAGSGYTALKSWDPNSTTLAALARVVASLQDTLKAYGILGG